mmetsp:Transcript_29300/g.21211  ORF Transcript_29300/g.21211 Transcript_29300/m.21211 type:complete len:284 (+) Transcript_29300:2050-2901(+)
MTLESNMTFLAAFGLADPLREETKETIKALEGTNVRILSGDHKETVIKVAGELEIIDINNPDANIMSGEELRKICRDISFETVSPIDGEPTYEFRGEIGSQDYKANMKAFKSKVAGNIVALSRCTPQDKLMFTALHKRSGARCAMTADGINDARALHEASVGFAMGSGCAVAKDSSDIIITDNNFLSLYTSIKWGRNIFDNCRKFIQFQVTINISCLIFVILGGSTTGKSPFSVIQLLWINLIMDVLAALALGTEAPGDKLKSSRIKATDNLIIPVMWRSISS